MNTNTGIGSVESKSRVVWAPALVAALIMGQTLYFKFMGAPESVYIFSTLGVEPWGRLAAGASELLAVALLLTPRAQWVGAGLGLGVMLGAIGSHVAVLGIVVQDDGGLLFGLAVVVALCCAAVLYLRRREWLRLVGR